MDPSEKCPHGVYKAFDPIALYCGLCNPNQDDRTLRTVPNFRPGKGAVPKEPVLHVDEFLAQPPGARLVHAKELGYGQTG
jgi:hypothetical protein